MMNAADLTDSETHNNYVIRPLLHRNETEMYTVTHDNKVAPSMVSSHLSLSHSQPTIGRSTQLKRAFTRNKGHHKREM